MYTVKQDAYTGEHLKCEDGVSEFEVMRQTLGRETMWANAETWEELLKERPERKITLEFGT